jgi:hypothetical protein
MARALRAECSQEREAIVMARFGRAILVCIASIMFVSMIDGTGEAVAAEPWWHVMGISSPASASTSEAVITLDVANIGDGIAGGVLDENLVSGNTPITVMDRLPEGVTATGVHPEGGEFNRNGVNGYPTLMKCSIEEQTVTCHYGVPVQPYEHMVIGISVKVAPGAGRGENEVEVSGGGAPEILSRHALAVEDPVPPYGVQSYELLPEEEGGVASTQAGSHPFQLTTALMFNTQAAQFIDHGSFIEHESGPEVEALGLTKDLHFDLPPGLLGNPTALPKCSLHVFLLLSSQKNIECPNNTVVGVASPILANASVGAWDPYVVSAPLFSLEPSVGEPAKFGFQTPVGPVILDTSVRTGQDYGVVVTVPDITEGVTFIGNLVTFWGVPGDSRHDGSRNHRCLVSEEDPAMISGGSQLLCANSENSQPLLIMPTSCGSAPYTTIEADSWSAPGEFTEPFGYSFQSSTSEPISEDGCNRLNFEPSISLTPDGQQGSTPTGLSVGIHVPQESSLNPTGLAEAAVKDTTVTLPAGVALNPAGADGLMACSLGQVALESPLEQSCPEASKVGTVEIHTPLLPHPLVGAAYLAQQEANPFGSLIALYLVVKDPFSGVIVKLAGEVKPDPITGQLVSTFDNTPPLPFEDLTLHFFGGSRAPLGTPALCGGYTTTASIAPWSGNAPVDSSSEFQITSGPNGTPCSDPLPFDPSLTTGSLNIQAGAFTPFTMTMSREDGNQNLDAIQLKMPSGLLGTLSNVKLCGEAEGNAGTCGPESLIGHTTVSVGLGGNPYTVTGGEVFITGPYEGAPYGLSIVNPAKAGPFNLGKVVVRAKIEVNRENAALTITSDVSGQYAIPQIIDGIPLQIKHVNVSIDRPDFTFNPTNCAPQEIGGSLTSSQGATSTLHVPFQVTNCATLKFKPIFTVSTAGKTSRKNGASLNVKLTYPKAPVGSQANIGKVKVDLPKQLPSRLTTLQKACPDSTFDANPAACPPDSRIGIATATTPVLPVHLEGPAYFVSHAGLKFPELIIALSGEGVTVYLHGETFISPQGITSSTFRTIPDVPIGVFELNLPQGPDSALAANANLCTAKLVMPTTFVGANGMSIKQSTTVTATGCPKRKTKAKKAKANKHKKNSGKKK